MTSAPETSSTQIPNSRDYFSTPSLKGLVQQLSHLAFFGDGLSLVLGAKGSGKTALCGELTQNLSQADDTVSIALTSKFELAECIEKVLLALGLDNSESLSVGEMLAELRHYVQALAQDKKLVTLIIDDAHYLDDQAIGALISLLQGRSDANVGLHLILLSEPGLDQRIDALQIIDVPVYDFDMPNLSPSELSRFLEHYHPDAQALSSPQLQKMWANSHGMPGVALALIDELDDGASHTPTEGGAGRNNAIPYAHIAAIVLLGLALIWSLVLTSDDEDSRKESTVALSVPTKDIAEETKNLYKNNSTSPVKSETPSTVSKRQELPKVDSNDPESDSQENATESDISTSAIETTLKLASPKIAVADTGPKPAEHNIADHTPPDSANNASDTPAKVAKTPVKPAVKKIEKGVFDLTKSEAFLMKQKPNAYTLQVVAASGRSLLEAYIKRQVNSSSLQMYRSVSRRKNWFIVVQGVYSSREEALKGIKSLPQEQSKAGPWPRKISAIQQEIETFRRK